jgi:hypothetical protein
VVVGIDASDIVVGLGTFHCLTQQIPYVWYSEKSPTCYWISNSDMLLINFITFEFLLS